MKLLATGQGRAFAVLLAVAAVLCGAAPATAAYPGSNGAIVFAGDRGGEEKLFLRSQGRIRVLLREGSFAGPVFSPHGRRIAVTRELPGLGRAVWVLDAQGRRPRRVTVLALAGAEPTWAPGGRLLAYAAGPVGARTIHAVRADGSGDLAVTAGPEDQHDPAWSSRRVVAYVQANPSGQDIYAVRPGGVPRRLTRTPGDDLAPAWSPGGDRLAFVRAGGPPKKRGVWVMSRWGHGRHRVVHVRGGVEQGVAWSPDGRRLLFAAGPPGRRRVYSVRPDGKRPRALSLPGSNARDPDWRPVGNAPVIAAAGDVACDPATRLFRGGLGTPRYCGMTRTSNLLLRPDLSAVLVLGDEQYPDGDLGRFYASFAPSWGRLKPLLRPVPGNHEYLTSGAAGYFDYFNGPGAQRGRAGDRARGYYSFELGAWHVVALNSNCGQVPGGCEMGSPQQRWLAADLARHPARCTLAFWHHPLFSSLAHSEGRGSKQTIGLWQTLYDARADLVLSGHQHFYERLQSQDAAGNLDAARGIRSFVVGTGGKALDRRDVADRNSVVFHNESFGILELTLHPRHYEWRYRTTNGDPFSDGGSAVCH